MIEWIMRGGRLPGQGGKVGGLDGCPEIVVEGAQIRAPAGAEASAVRYQLALGRMARDCARRGEDLKVRVGIEGAAMLGPAGQPGAYYGNLRVALRRKDDAELFGAKTYRVGAAIPAGAARGEFSLLVEDLEAPVISFKAAEDYEILIGFVSGGENEGKQAPKRRKGR